MYDNNLWVKQVFKMIVQCCFIILSRWVNYVHITLSCRMISSNMNSMYTKECIIYVISVDIMLWETRDNSITHNVLTKNEGLQYICKILVTIHILRIIWSAKQNLCRDNLLHLLNLLHGTIHHIMGWNVDVFSVNTIIYRNELLVTSIN